MSDDFSFTDVDIDSAVDMKTVPEAEYNLTITEIEPNKEKFYVLTTMNIEGQDEFTRDVRNFVFFPKPGDDSKKINNKLVMIRDFCKAFGIEGEDRKNPTSWVGKRGSAILSEGDNPPYGMQNEVKKLVLPA